MKPTLGTCYYPEHWPEDIWLDDAKRMADLGLTMIRIGEFAWSRIEPKPEQMEWAWMDRAIETLGGEGLQLVLGTPTATPPRWMLDRYPDMLALDADGHPRKFGSRRHYCFSHVGYLQESVRIASLMAERYGQSSHLGAWQTDNEYGCHDTTVSYSDSARVAFRYWLRQKYQSIDVLNQAWGNVFWSMEYTDFEDIDLPNLTVTEASPSHVLDFRRFSSDQVVAYNRAQVEAIREYSSAPISHNYMGRVVDFDHYKVGEDMEIATWDSYPLGFLEDRSGTSEEWKKKYYRQGDPDLQALHHDLYRAVGKGRWWVMEQQPGPVNWAPHNPAPLPGMVRLWTWEAIAHQAETVCYFRWRQAPFAQEQMHAGLLRPDSEPAVGFGEAAQVAKELAELGDIEPAQAPVAMVFDYESCWAWEAQPQGETFDYFELLFDFYRGLRRLGLSVDILPPTSDSFEGYSLVMIPGLMAWTDELLSAMQGFTGELLVGPRAGSKTADFTIPEQLPPAIPGFDCKVAYAESIRPGVPRAVSGGGVIHKWLENIETTAHVDEQLEDGSTLLVRDQVGDLTLNYLAGWPDAQALNRMLKTICARSEVDTVQVEGGLRIRDTASHRFILNYGAEAVVFDGEEIEPAGVRIKQLG